MEIKRGAMSEALDIIRKARAAGFVMELRSGEILLSGPIDLELPEWLLQQVKRHKRHLIELLSQKAIALEQTAAILAREWDEPLDVACVRAADQLGISNGREYFEASTGLRKPH